MVISKALAAKAGAVVLAGGIAVSGVAAANASTAPARHKVKTPTVLTAKVGPTHINKRHPFGAAHITGQLTVPTTPAGQVSGVRILLERENNRGRWVVVQHGRTGFHGYVRFLVHHVAKGATFDLVFTGNKNFAPSKSNVIIISAS
jgi:hypothetical protein